MSLQDQKRVTIKLKCPNPLFEEWLTNWKEQAVAKESKMQHIFNHALQSLRKYPLPLESGRDCKILKGFGDKLCKMLDEKLKAHKKIHKTVNTVNNTPININIEKTVSEESKKQIPNETKKIRTTTKQYIPQYDAGGYAILITLYKQTLEPNYPGFLSKTQIIQLGKDLVNSSFTKPEPGSRYTAWSSMRTLISKNLVSKISHPPKFSLTQEGAILAKKLFDNSKDNNGDKRIHIGSENCVYNRLKTKYTSQDFVPDEFTEKIEELNMKNANFKLYDVDIPDEFTDELLKNTWILENDTFSVDAPVSKENKCLNNVAPMGLQEKDQYIRSDLEENCTGISEATERGGYRFLEPLNSEEFVRTSSQASSKMPDSSEENSCSSQPISLKQKSTNSFRKFSSTSSISSVKSAIDKSTKNKQTTLKKFVSSNSVTSTTNTASVIENFVMAPNSFDIILYVDNNETSGSNSQNNEILITLTRQGIKHEVKDLKIGDFIWICRDRISQNELVLPYIVERKRMDDFAHSIKDKRYHEQKFRLKRSGLENLIYLVESHGKNQHTGLPLRTLYQAASNTAIQENFFIKFTENINDTVEYLANFSRILVKIFKSKTLASCSKDNIKPVDINYGLVSLMTFKEFNESSVKNKRMKVTDLFVKMLIQIKGMSVERALAITEIYPTPILLKRIYQENPDDKGEKLLSGIKYGKYKKSIGIVLSKTVYQAFSKAQY